MALFKSFRSLKFQVVPWYQSLFARKHQYLTFSQAYKHQQYSNKPKFWTKYKHVFACGCGLLTGITGKKLFSDELTVTAASPPGLLDCPVSDRCERDVIGAHVCELSANDVDKMRQYNPLFPSISTTVVYVAFVENFSVAAKAGLCSGDFIIRVNGKTIYSVQEYLNFINTSTNISLTVLRNSAEVELTVNV